MFRRARSLLAFGLTFSEFTERTETENVFSTATLMFDLVAEGDTAKIYLLRLAESMVAFSVSRASLITDADSFIIYFPPLRI